MRKRLTIRLIVSWLAIPILVLTVEAQQQRNDKAQVMLLGVYHFANPNLDLVKSNFPDHLSAKKQQEISEVLDLLAKFKPTKIVLEAPPDRVDVANNYEGYLKGEYQLTANESNQIGFRLAKRLGHKQIYLADYRMDMDLNSVIAAAQETNNKYFLETIQRVMAEAQEMQKRHAQGSVREALVELNEPQLQDKTRDLYLQLARVRSKEKYVGADVLTGWYQRNLRILTNILQLIESPQDRVLVIFGQNHIPYLREGVKSSSDIQLVEPNDYLRKD